MVVDGMMENLKNLPFLICIAILILENVTNKLCVKHFVITYKIVEFISLDLQKTALWRMFLYCVVDISSQVQTFYTPSSHPSDVPSTLWPLSVA